MPLLGIVEVPQPHIGENPYGKGLPERPEKGPSGEAVPGFALVKRGK
jgi:hypothetical protein